jgi:hypothetical protein
MKPQLVGNEGVTIMLAGEAYNTFQEQQIMNMAYWRNKWHKKSKAYLIWPRLEG